jgi:hypothetical protein
MKGQWTGGKGSSQRRVDLQKFNTNFDNIFRKKEQADGNESQATDGEKNKSQRQEKE